MVMASNELYITWNNKTPIQCVHKVVNIVHQRFTGRAHKHEFRHSSKHEVEFSNDTLVFDFSILFQSKHTMDLLWQAYTLKKIKDVGLYMDPDTITVMALLRPYDKV